MEKYLEIAKNSKAFKEWNAGNRLYSHDDPEISYHGSRSILTIFDTLDIDKRIEIINSFSTKHSAAGLMGTFFTNSADVANMFIRKVWYDPDSDYYETGNIHPCFVKLRNPHIMYPIQLAQMAKIDANCPNEHRGRVFIDFLWRMVAYNHDGIIIHPSNQSFSWSITDDHVMPANESEYQTAQFVIFEPLQFNVMSIYNIPR